MGHVDTKFCGVLARRVVPNFLYAPVCDDVETNSSVVTFGRRVLYYAWKRGNLEVPMRTLIGQSVMAEISAHLKKANHNIIELGVANEVFIETARQETVDRFLVYGWNNATYRTGRNHSQVPCWLRE